MTDVNLLPKILLIGANGQLGSTFHHYLSEYPNLLAVDRGRADISKPDLMLSLLNEYKPEVIINTAAYTAVDKAESEPDLAAKLNTLGPELLAKWAADNHALLVHFSSDYVYDGSGSEPWHEDDICDPLNVYGRTKLAGDLAIQQYAEKYLIFRTSWIYSEYGSNFLKTMLRLFNEKTELNIVDDQVGVPTSTHTLATNILAILEQLSWGKMMANKSGVYHLTDLGETSWFGFAQEIKYLTGSLVCLNPVSSTSFKTTAVRPHNSRLSLSKIEHTFKLTFPVWQDSLQRVYSLI